MKKFNLVLLFLFLFSCTSTSHRYVAGDELQTAYDDVFDGERVRAPYRGVYSIYQNLSENSRREFERQTNRDFRGDNPLLSLPRIISDSEDWQLRRGVDQRARAIQAFLKDYYSGEQNIINDQVIPKKVLERIIERSGESLWAEKMNLENYSFTYGPDIIRGPPEPGFPNGRYFVVEDNTGFIGGLGDLNLARELLDRYTPEYTQVVDSPDPSSFYDRMATELKEKAKKYNGIPVFIQNVSEYESDNEHVRITELMEERGVEVFQVNLETKNTNWRNGKRLRVIDGDVYLEKKSDSGRISKQKVGHIFNFMEPYDIENNYELNRNKQLLTWVEYFLDENELRKNQKDKLSKLSTPDETTGKIDWVKLENYLEQVSPYDLDLDKQHGIKGVFDSVFEGKVGMTNPPGLEFINDKEFYIYVEELIKYYLKEEPILKNMKTSSFTKILSSGEQVLDEDALETVFKNLDENVIKGVDGRGGNAVWVGPKMNEEEIPLVREKIKKNPSRYIYQKYTPLSTMADYIGDLRYISVTSDKHTNVADVPWARVVSKDGNGKVNISDNGMEAVVLVRRNMPHINVCLEEINFIIH